MKTLVIGIDSATWSVLESMIRAGELPVFERLVAGGASGVLTSTLPPLTPPAWTSIVTGVNPGRHGIWDFVDQDPASYRVIPLDFGRMQTPAIWDIYAAHQRRVGVMNFPLAYPPPTVDDFFVSGICSPETGVFTHPASLMADIRAHDYRIYPRLGPGAGPRRYLRAIRELTRRQLDLFADLLGRTAPDLAWLVLMGVDWIQHYFWDGGRDPSGPVQTVYRLMDQALGELLSRLDDDWHVLVLSDHGACGIDGVINVNSLLEEWGLLHRKPDLSGPSDRIRNTVMKTTWDLGRRLPFRLKQLLKRAMPGRVREHVLSTIRGQADLHRLID